MKFLDSSDPIIACSSGGFTNTGIAIIRLSGFENLVSLNDFFSIDLNKVNPRYAYFCKILDGCSNTIDEIVLTYFENPKSFNGENILELSVHGNILNIHNIINLFCENSLFRKAYPGEFSYRALRNKKLNLTQVEGLDLFLNASNPLSLKQGQSLLNGSLQKTYEELLVNFKRHKSAIELSIDFLVSCSVKKFCLEFEVENS
jgi:tRNA modification GTPase